MSTNDESRDGICILSFDNGGPGTYSQLLIIKEYMSRLAYDLGVDEDDIHPADYFDLMGGVGFGGLVALLLGHLRMNVNQAIETLVEVALAVFPEEPQQIPDPERNSRKLRDAIEDLLQISQIPLDTRMYDRSGPSTRCKVVLYAATTTNITHPYAFRTYPSRGSSLDPTIVEAICATISMPSQFVPVALGTRLRRQSFIGGPPGANNPTRELLLEAGFCFGIERRVAQIISIGCGLPRKLSPGEMKEATVGRLQEEMAADCQLVARTLSSRLINVEAYLRLNVETWTGVPEIDEWDQLGGVEVHTAAYLETSTVANAVDVSWRCLQSRFGTVTLKQLNLSTSIKVTAKTAPAVSSHYVLRTEPWRIMVYYLFTTPSVQQVVLPITGMGGCGKTQMVSYFIQESTSLFTHTVFLEANSASSIQSGLQVWAQALGDGHEHDLWNDAIGFLTNVALGERCLLVLDNADDPELDLRPFMPRSPSTTIIITSRNRDLDALSTTYHLKLGTMEEAEALATLLHAARRQLPLDSEELKDAKVLIKELGYLPLAVAQAGMYCHELSSIILGVLHIFSFTQYLKLFYAEPTKNPAPSLLDDYQRGIYTTLDLSYQVIPRAIQQFLYFISSFHHTDIPLSAFAASARQGFADRETYLERSTSHQVVISELNSMFCRDGFWNQLHMQDMVRVLRSFSFVTATSINDGDFLQLHPVVRSWCNDMVSLNPQHYRAMAIQILTSCGGQEDFLLNRYLVPTILDISVQADIQDLHVNDMMALGEILREQGLYRKAIELLETAQEKMKRSKEASTEKTLLVTAKLALLYWDGGRRDEAERLEVEVLQERKWILGMEHPDTIRAAEHLSSTYCSQDRWNEAEKLEVKVLEGRLRLLGMDHVDTIRAAANLASIYYFQDRWNEAETLQLQVLEQQTRILGTSHPDTSNSAVYLATIYCEQGRWKEAEDMQLEALEQMRANLGREHKHTISAAENLAATYSEQEKWEKAIRLQLELLEVKRRVLGDEHPKTISASAALASTYHFQGRLDEAEQLKLEVLHRGRIVMGTRHQYTILASDSLSATRSLRGESEFSRQLISTMFPHTKLVGEDSKRNQRLPADIAEEPCLWYYETIPLSKTTGEGSTVHKGHSYCLPLVPLNFQLSENSIVIGENSTFSEISSRLYSVEGSTLPVALEQTGGPYSRWRIPKAATKIPRGLQRIYIADIGKPFTLALVRDVVGDTPLLIDMSSLKTVGSRTVGDIIGGALEGRGHTWSSIKLLSSSGDIQGSPYTLIQNQTGGLYSTIFFVLMNDDPLTYNFRSEEECMGPLPLRAVFFQSQRLVDSAPRMKVLTLPAIHLSRALYHLIICLSEAIVTSKVEESMGAYFISRLNSLVSKLKATFQTIEDRVDDSDRDVRRSLTRFFYELCEEQPGVVAVRQSFESFKGFVLDDLGDTAKSEYFNSEIFHGGAREDHAPIQAEGPSNPHGGNDSTGSCDSSSSYDGDSSVESVGQSEPLEAAGNRQDVDG